MKRVFLILAVFGILITSCKKDDSDEGNDPQPQPSADYMQLEIGNYWVYQWYSVDSLGNETIMSVIDSAYIYGDTLVDDVLYYKKTMDNGSYTEYLRDSSGYLVNLEGEILFSDHDFNSVFRIDTIHPSLCYVEYMMYNIDSTISVPFGDYENSLEVRGKVIPLNPSYPYGIVYTHFYYADGVGMFKSSTFYYAAPYRKIEQRLTKFGNALE